MNEKQIALKVSAYLKDNHSNIVYRWDLSADIKLNKYQINLHARLQIKKRGYPDLFIAEPKKKFNGLYIELKKDTKEVYRKNGTLRQTKHIQEQFEMLEELNGKGYYAVFGCGYENTIDIIEEYLNET